MLHHALDATRVAILDLLIYAEAQARLPPPLFPYTTLFRSTASKLVMFWTAPSSTTRKSSLVSPVIGLPFLSVTTTSTVTRSTAAGKDAPGEADGAGEAERADEAGAGEGGVGPEAGGCARPTDRKGV